MFNEFLDGQLALRDEVKLGYVIVAVDAAEFIKLGMTKLQEGRWVQSKKRDWLVRVDPADPNRSVQQHVHVARSEHVNSKNMQVAWNSDGSRHDKVAFNQSIRGMQTAKRVARDALGLGDDVVLECTSREEEERILNESMTNLVKAAPVVPVLLVLRVQSL